MKAVLRKILERIRKHNCHDHLKLVAYVAGHIRLAKCQICEKELLFEKE